LPGDCVVKVYRVIADSCIEKLKDLCS